MKSNTRALFFCLGIVNSGMAFAGAADYVYTPVVEFGEKEIDFKSGYANEKDGTRSAAASLGFGYGATESWFSEVYLKQERSGNQLSNIAEWENKFQLTETGKYPVDVGLITELEAPLGSHTPWEFKFGPLFQTEFGKLQLNANLLFERAFGPDDGSGTPYTTVFQYQWQAKYRWQPVLEIGVQGLGELGTWDHWDAPSEQTHSLGPAVFGKIDLGNRQAVTYNAAWLVGHSAAAPDHTFRLQMEYEY